MWGNVSRWLRVVGGIDKWCRGLIERSVVLLLLRIIVLRSLAELRIRVELRVLVGGLGILSCIPLSGVIVRRVLVVWILRGVIEIPKVGILLGEV